MLYNNGKQHKKLFLNGKQIRTIYKDGVCIYPGCVNLTPVFTDYLSLQSGTTAIIRSDQLPENIQVNQYNSLFAWSYLYGSSYDFVDIDNICTHNVSNEYNVGDVVSYAYTGNYTDGVTYTGKLFTCIKYVPSNTPFDYFDEFNYSTSHVWIHGVYPGLCGEYSSEVTYSFGDIVVVFTSNTYIIYTAIYDITTPEEFNDSHWIVGYYPNLQKYSTAFTYSIGDTVYNSNNNQIYTYVNSTIWYTGYYPKITYDQFSLSKQYYPGDIIYYNGSLYTCIKYSLGNRITDTTYFIKAYCPKYAKYNNLRSYSIGDILYDSTSCRIIEVAFPDTLDIADQYPIYGWYDNNIFYWYCEYSKILGNYIVDVTFPSSLTTISGLSGFDVAYIQSLATLFKGTKITDIIPIRNWNTVNIASIQATFANCTLLSDISPLMLWDTKNMHSMAETFSGCTSLISLLGLDRWDVNQVITMEGMFHNCTNLQDISALYNWETTSLLSIRLNISQERTNYGMFQNCSSLPSLHGLENFNVSNVTDMSYVFQNCTSLADISAISNWNTAKVTTIQRMFQNCSSLTSLSNIHWDMSACTNYSEAFRGCTSLQEVREIYWLNMSKGITDCFRDCSSLVVADFSKCTAQDPQGYNTGEYLFRGCYNLERCDLGELYTATTWSSGGTSFGNCTKLSILIIRNTQKVMHRVYVDWYGTRGYLDGLRVLANNNGKVYVPQSMLSAYQADDGWIDLINRGVEILPLEGSPYEQPGSI